MKKINENLSTEEKQVERFVKKLAKEFGYSMKDAVRFIQNTISKMGLKETVNENIFDAAKRFSNAFFDSLSKNAENSFLKAAHKKRLRREAIDKMQEIARDKRELEEILRKIDAGEF